MVFSIFLCERVGEMNDLNPFKILNKKYSKPRLFLIHEKNLFNL